MAAVGWAKIWSSVMPTPAIPLRTPERTRWYATASTIPAVGGFVAWLVETLASALVGLVVGFVVVGVMHLIPKRKPRPGHEAEKPAGIEDALRLEHPAPDVE